MINEIKTKVRKFIYTGWEWYTNQYGVRIGEKTYTRRLLYFNHDYKAQARQRKVLAEILQVPEKDLKQGNLDIVLHIERIA